MPDVCNYGYVPLSHSENIVTRIRTTATTSKREDWSVCEAQRAGVTAFCTNMILDPF